MNLEDVLAATGGRIHGEVFAREFTGFAYDSRILRPGELFLAVKTARADGHDYILDACRKGAAGVLCERPPDLGDLRVTCIVVGDVREALTDWARYILRKYETEVIGVTGSTGKTTTKEAVAAVLSARYAVFKNYGSFNDRYGLPISLGTLTPAHEKAVLEIACDHFDEIRELAEITRPRIGVVTSVSAAHLETLGSLDNIAREKGMLVEALPPEGYAVLNRDDPRVRAMAKRTRAAVIYYGVGRSGSDDPPPVRPAIELWAEDVAMSLEGLSFVAWSRRPDGSAEACEVRLRLLGKHHVYAGLAALAVGLACGIPLPEAASALATVGPVPGRMSPLPGLKGSLLLDDTYNANPAAMLAALEALRELPAWRRIAVLGDMLELGAYEEEAHAAVGRRAAEVVDLLITKGERARWIADAARKAGLPESKIVVTYTAADAIRYLQATVQGGDLVLLKGSAETRLEEITRALMAHPEEAGQRLVRQGVAWEQVRLVTPGRPTWVEVNLDAIAHNVRRVVEIVGPNVQVMAVLKADAYGHGALRVARTALNNGARMLGVACLGEALALRRAGIAAPILILGYTPPWQAREVVLHDISVALFSLDVAQALNRAAIELQSKAKVHIKVDTGMGRLGLLPEQVGEFVEQLRSWPSLVLEGIFTHFAMADSHDKSYTRWQLSRFQGVLRELEEKGVRIPYVHAANSAAILEMPETHFNTVRLGIAMYGLDPSPEVPCPPDFLPALTFKTMVAQVKSLPAGSPISYGCTYRTARPSRIAVIPVGYADGFRRAPAHWGEVLVRGKRAPIVGRVCMDQTMIDVTDIPGVREGDEVVLIGRQGQEEITVEDVAKRLGTINYEVISEIMARVPRVS